MPVLEAWNVIARGPPPPPDRAWATVHGAASKLASRRTSNRALAEDLTATLLLALFRRSVVGQLPTFENSASVLGYLKASLDKAFAGQHRRQLREAGLHPEANLGDQPVSAEDEALALDTQALGERRARQHWAHTTRLVEQLATGAIDARLPRHRAEARKTWEELQAVHVARRDLDQVIAEAEGPLAGPALKRARLRRYQAFKRFRAQMLGLALEKRTAGEWTELDLRAATARIGLELMSFQLSSRVTPGDHPSKRGGP